MRQRNVVGAEDLAERGAVRSWWLSAAVRGERGGVGVEQRELVGVEGRELRAVDAGREQPARLPYPAHIDVAHHSRSRGPAAGAGAAGVAPSVLLRQGEERARGKAAAARQKEELGGGQQVACGVGSGEGEAVPERAVDERGRGGEPRIQGLREGERGCKELGGERGGEVASRRVDPACLGFRV